MKRIARAISHCALAVGVLGVARSASADSILLRDLRHLEAANSFSLQPVSDDGRDEFTDRANRIASFFDINPADLDPTGITVEGAALQIAIWEALLHASSADLGSTSSWLRTSFKEAETASGVPEPATLLLVGFGALVLARGLRRSAQSTKK